MIFALRQQQHPEERANFKSCKISCGLAVKNDLRSLWSERFFRESTPTAAAPMLDILHRLLLQLSDCCVLCGDDRRSKEASIWENTYAFPFNTLISPKGCGRSQRREAKGIRAFNKRRSALIALIHKYGGSDGDNDGAGAFGDVGGREIGSGDAQQQEHEQQHCRRRLSGRRR